MNANDLVKVIVGVVVGALLLTTIVNPVIHNASQESTYQADYAYRATETIGDYEYTCDSTALYLNGTAIQYKTYDSDVYSVGVSSDVAEITWREDATMWGSSVASGVQLGTNALEINSDGTWELTYTSGGNQQTASSTSSTLMENGIFAKDDGELAVYYMRQDVAKTFSVPEGTEVTLFCNYGQATDGDSKTWGLAYRATLVGETITVDYATITDGTTTTDVSSLFSVVFGGTVTTDNGITTYTDCYANNVVTGYTVNARSLAAVPYEYQVDNEYAQLLGVIPLLIAASLIIGVVGLIWSRKE